MALVKLFSKRGSYTGADGQEHKTVRFYVECGEALVPIEPVYFKNKETGKDKHFMGRKEVLKAFAETLPEKGEVSSEPEKGEVLSEPEKGEVSSDSTQSA